MNNPGDNVMNRRPTFLPPPFHSDRPVDDDETELDSILTRLSELLVEDRLAEAAGVIENGRRVSGLHGIKEVSYGYGAYTQQRYVWVDDQLGEHFHFEIGNSQIQFFVPSMCRNLINSNFDSLTLGRFVLDPHNPDTSKPYFDFHCGNEINLRLFYDDSNRERYIVSQIMMYGKREPISNP